MNGEIYITIDMDWACDDVLLYTYRLLKKHKVKATICVTNDAQALEPLRQDEGIELGVHPNFNGLLFPSEGNSGNSIDACINAVTAIVAEAVTYRSHSLTQNTRIINEMGIRGFRYDLNTFIPHDADMVIAPYKYLNGILKLPFFYEDDLYFTHMLTASPDDYLKTDHKIKIFNFHPIHLFLNTESAERYQNCKADYHDAQKLKKFINNYKPGTRTFFETLIKTAKCMGMEFKRICDINPKQFNIKI